MTIKPISLAVWVLGGIAVILMMGAAVDVFSAARRLFGIALVSLDAAYFLILAENWVAGRGVQTRGGMVDKNTSPALYFLIYFILAVAGLIALVVFLSAFVFSI